MHTTSYLCISEATHKAVIVCGRCSVVVLVWLKVEHGIYIARVRGLIATGCVTHAKTIIYQGSINVYHCKTKKIIYTVYI